MSMYEGEGYQEIAKCDTIYDSTLPENLNYMELQGIYCKVVTECT